jgi:tetratricopeptide (TPR) repeat protein
MKIFGVKSRRSWVKVPIGVTLLIRWFFHASLAELALAQEQFSKQELQEQRKDLELKVSQNPKNFELRNQLAKSYARSNEFAKAEQHLLAIIAQDSTNFVAYNNLSNIYFLQGHLDSAEAGYSKALHLAKTSDDSLGIRLNRGVFFYATGAFYTAHLIFVETIHHENDLRRIERLLGIKFQEVDSVKTGNEELQPLSVATINIKKMALSAIEINRRKREKEKSSTGGNKADSELKQDFSKKKTAKRAEAPPTEAPIEGNTEAARTIGYPDINEFRRHSFTEFSKLYIGPNNKY